MIDGFRQPHRFTKNKHDAGVVLILTEETPSKLSSEDIFPDDTNDGTCHPTNQPNDYFFKSIGTALDQYHQTFEKFSLVCEINAEDKEPSLSEFLKQYATKKNK